MVGEKDLSLTLYGETEVWLTAVRSFHLRHEFPASSCGSESHNAHSYLGLRRIFPEPLDFLSARGCIQKHLNMIVGTVSLHS